jgi:isoaspartyl peptidase/L-asparaginase-like protein (Ntn-hydrolase superfamily)
MKYLHQSVDKASRESVKELFDEGGMGGVIALDNNGNGEWTAYE